MAGWTTTTRTPRGQTREEPEAIRRTPTPPEALLELQRHAGNHAVSRMVQRIALGGPATDEDRSMVAMELSQLPIELRERLIGELGAATIRNVVTSRFLLTLLRALGNDTARIAKLLSHLDEAEVRLLRDLENDYSDKGFAALVAHHPIVVKRKIREQTMQRARQVGMVVVAAAVLDPTDVILYSHIDYALSHVGGTVQMLPTADLSTLDAQGTLYVVEHGNVGFVGAYRPNKPRTMAHFVGDLLHPQRGLPADFQGTIKITTCYSGVTGQATDSAVGIVKTGLAAAQRPGIEVIGAMGPSITNAEISSKYPVIDPAAFNDALYAQEYLLGVVAARNVQTEGRLGLAAYGYGKHGTLKADWAREKQKAPGLEEQAAIAARISQPFYVDFLAIAGAHNLLLADNARKARDTS